MIATEHFVHIHLHKSGGTFVNECLLRFFPDARMLGYHLPAGLIPAPFASLPVLGFVRNPWSYYVSWYAFQRERAQPNALFRATSDHGRLDFCATVRNLLDLGQAAGRLDELLPLLPADYGNKGINLPRFALEPIRDSGAGFYSYLYRYMYNEAQDRLRIGKLEQLREELPRMLAETGATISRELAAFVQTAPARNTSAHADYHDYYDTATAALVRERDHDLVERFDYRFDA